MATEDNKQAIKEITDKVDNLTKELANIRKELKVLSSLSNIDTEIIEVKSTLISSIEEIKKLDKKLDVLATSKESEVATKKIEELSTTLSGLEGDIQEIKNAKEAEVIIKKVDDILLSLSDTDVLG